MKNNTAILAITLFATTSLFAAHHGGGRIGGLQSAPTTPTANAPLTKAPAAPSTTSRFDVRGQSTTRPVGDYQRPEGTTTGNEFKKSPEGMNWNPTK